MQYDYVILRLNHMENDVSQEDEEMLHGNRSELKYPSRAVTIFLPFLFLVKEELLIYIRFFSASTCYVEI
jgi:hypothetical protein